MENREEIRKAIKYLTFHCLPANESTNLHKYVMMAISALEKQEQTNAQSVNSMRTSRPNALESLNILEQVKDDKGCVPMSLVRQAFRNVMEHDKGKENSIGYKIGYKKGYVDGLNRISDYEDKIRKEAYDKGYDDATAEIGSDEQAIAEKAYQRGLSDAWETARKICTNWVLSDSVLSEIFGMDKTIDDIMKESTAFEAIEKIRAYEQEKEEQIQVGDEVTAEHGGFTFTVTWMSDVCICGIDSDGRCYSYEINEVDGKTGNHHEIAEVLEKMRGE